MADRRENNPNRKLKLEPCVGCAGTGTEAVVHGDTSFSGDDPCPHCSGSGKTSSKINKKLESWASQYE